MLIGLLIISGLTWILYNNLQTKDTELDTKNTEIKSLNQRIRDYSTLAELANISKPPTLYASGVQIVSSYPMIFNYNYPDTYDDRRSIIVLYVPQNGSVVSIDLFIDSISRYPIKLTLQRGNAFRNETWEKIGSSSAVWDNITWSWEYWQAPVVWSRNVTESGIIDSPKMSKGWYTLSMFGPISIRVENLYKSPSLPQLTYELHKLSKIDSYHVIITVTVKRDGMQSFFAASSDWE